MNFPIRDSFGRVNEVLRARHLSQSVTPDNFIQHSQGKTLKELQFENKRANPAELYGSEVSEQGLGPNGHRYIQDANNPGRVIDMRHFIESADVPFGQGEALGALTEIQQGRQGIDSAWEKEDYNSNFLGAVFRNNYYDPDAEISDSKSHDFVLFELLIVDNKGNILTTSNPSRDLQGVILEIKPPIKKEESRILIRGWKYQQGWHNITFKSCQWANSYQDYLGKHPELKDYQAP